ncbi:shikimate kinase [Butyrivibrio sp. MC2013]|uniref:shikimate kinase n=1 Tax=Butyrivibrio sp. MC2013 TaxID=1280686 RepID=UPI0009DB8EBF
MPASGKSTIGVILAKLMGMRFIDSDILIQDKTGRRLAGIIEEEGVDGFISIEEDVNASIEASGTVIATGGSVVYGQRAMEHFKEIGKIVYLKVSEKTIKGRLDDIKGRGVVIRRGQTFEDLYRERTALYEQYADLIIDEDGHSAEEVLSMLKESLDIE